MQYRRNAMLVANRPIHPGDDPEASRPVVALPLDVRGPGVFASHRHTRAQLVYASAGTLSVHTATGQWVVVPRQAVWVPAGVEHEVRYPRDLSLRSLYIHPALADDLPASCCVVTLNPLLRELILRAMETPPDHPPDSPEARIMAVIRDELGSLTPEPLHLPLPLDPRVKLVTSALLREPGDPRPLSAWAREAGASERTLARRFLRETGMSFGAWRQRLRLLTALTRLIEGQPVTGIAFDLGYESPSAFIAMFRRTLGVSPGVYLERKGGRGR